MNDTVKQEILRKNQRLIDMVIQRAKRDFPEDIGLIGLTGSFSTGDYHEKSDLNLIIVSNTLRAWQISCCFILGDVGYNIYFTPWEPRIEAQSNLDHPMVSHLVDLEILYYAQPEDLQCFLSYRQKALDELNKPIGPNCIRRAEKDIDRARQEYANALLADDVGAVRKAAGGVLCHVINAVVSLNNTYIRRGVKRYLDELRTYVYLPKDFESKYHAVIRAATIDELRGDAHGLLKSVVELHRSMLDRFVAKPVPDYDSLCGTYEELWCRCRNKVLNMQAADVSYAFHTALGAQNYLDDMTRFFGTPKFDLMQYFDAGYLQPFREAFLRAMDEFRAEYDKVGRAVERFDTFEQLYEKFMR